MQELKSSMFSHAEYDSANQSLTLRFHTGSRYRYSPFTEEQFKEFIGSKSAGKYFSEHIRNNPRLTVETLADEAVA